VKNQDKKRENAKMTESSKQYFLLPKQLSIENVSPLLKEITNLAQKTLVEIDFKNVREFDSSAAALFNYLKRNFPSVSFKNVTPGFNQMFSMFSFTGESPGKSPPVVTLRKRLLALADIYLRVKKQSKNYLILLADEIYHTFRYIMKGRGIYPGEIFNQLFHMGYKSFPIVSLIALLVGITTTIISLQQLRLFGADIYVADLVGFGMIVELVPLMTGIIMAGKIGAAITAEIASMKVLEEIDALKTMGIIPEKFLMVPRLIAITLAVPLLVAAADFIGIFASIVVVRIISDIPPNMFLTEMFTMVKLGDFFIGLLKTLVFGWVVVITSGFKGFSVKRGAVGVGIATTQSVVLSIAMIIVYDCLFALVLYG
jgi:phospholipid/cholesterol/gamma-HCH transport system permease protein